MLEELFFSKSVEVRCIYGSLVNWQARFNYLMSAGIRAEPLTNKPQDKTTFYGWFMSGCLRLHSVIPSDWQLNRKPNKKSCQSASAKSLVKCECVKATASKLSPVQKVSLLEMWNKACFIPYDSLPKRSDYRVSYAFTSRALKTRG